MKMMLRVSAVALLLLLSVGCTTVTSSSLPALSAAPSSLPSPSAQTTCTYRHAANGGWLPDPSCTPGALNPDVTQATIASTICKTGWTATVRPPLSVTEPQ